MIKKRVLIQQIIFVAAVLCIFPGSGDVLAEKPPLLIFDTDLSSDVDDVGAVALLHGLANQGRVHIWAMMISSGDTGEIDNLLEQLMPATPQ